MLVEISGSMTSLGFKDDKTGAVLSLKSLQPKSCTAGPAPVARASDTAKAPQSTAGPSKTEKPALGSGFRENPKKTGKAVEMRLWRPESVGRPGAGAQTAAGDGMNAVNDG